MIWCPRQMPKTGTSPSERADRADRAADGRGIAGTVREEHAVGLACEHSAAGGRRRHDLDLAARVPTSWRRIDALIPKSYATTENARVGRTDVVGLARS